jgi:hypothetical protein
MGERVDRSRSSSIYLFTSGHGYWNWRRRNDMAMEWTEVSSSNLKAIGYDDEENEMQVEFLDGSIYSYSDVPQESFNDVLSGAPSVGRAFNAVIKGRYSGTRI